MDEKNENEIVKELQAIRSWLVGIWVAIICLMVLTSFFSIATAAEPHAVVSFNDAEHLAALTDSVIGVCDTIVATEAFMEEGHSAIIDSFRFILDTIGVAIACRELVCVTAEWPRKEMKWLPREGNYPKIYLEWKEIDIPMEWREVFISGQAIIFYREIKEK